MNLSLYKMKPQSRCVRYLLTAMLLVSYMLAGAQDGGVTVHR
jgi:hypothetical protein